MFIKCSNENESLTKISYKVTYVLAKCGKPFIDGGIVITACWKQGTVPGKIKTLPEFNFGCKYCCPPYCRHG